MALNVAILLGGEHHNRHPINNSLSDFPRMRKVMEKSGKISTATRGTTLIGSGVTLSHGCTIVSGVSIGDGAVIGAGAIVTRDIPAIRLGCWHSCKSHWLQIQ